MTSLLRSLVLVVVAGVCIGSAVLWWRSRTQSDVLAVRSPAGHLQVLASHRGGIVGFSSDIPFQAAAAGTFDALSVSAETVHPAAESVFDPTAVWRSAVGFKLATGPLSLSSNSSPTYRAVRIPHWAPVAVSGAMTFMLARGPLRKRRWRKQGRCRNCGYDLRESPDRCPECGVDTRPADDGAKVPVRRRPDAYVVAMLSVLVVLELVIAAQFWRAGSPPADGSLFTDDEVAAGLNRRIGEFDSRGMTVEEAVAALSNASGVKIEAAWDEVNVAGLPGDSPVNVRLRDVTLRGALGQLFLRNRGGEIAIFPAGNAVRVVGEPTLSNLGAERHVLRFHDARRLTAAWRPDDRATSDERAYALLDLCAELAVSEDLYISWGIAAIYATPEQHRDVEALMAGVQDALPHRGSARSEK